MSERKDPAAATPPLPETTSATPSPDQPPHLRPKPRQGPKSRADLLDRVLRVAHRSPGGIAVAETRRRRRLTYGELDRTTRRLARRLREEGVGPETVVGVYCRRGVELVVGALSIWRAGGVYLPLDPAYPVARLEAMAEAAQPHLLLVADDESASLGSLAAHPTLSVGPWLEATVEAPAEDLEDAVATPKPGGDVASDDPPADPDAASPGPPSQAPHPLQAAYILFTSGTSGRPKGVVVSRSALSWYADAARDHYQLTATDRVLQLASASFDISIGEIFPTLAVGATVVVDNLGTATEVFERCRRHRITVLFPATVLWHELALRAAEDPGVVPDSLRLVSFGGERVSQQRLERWLATVGRQPRLVNGYGPTEATVEATVYDLSAEGAGVDGRRIGHPVLGVRAAVVDGRGEPVEPGEEGELVVTSAGLARGYLGQPRVTAERFTPDPAASTPGGRRYRTGDRARQPADGFLEITGRCDRQTKIRGLRIEPEEVEHLLERHPEVRAAVVAAVDDGHGSRQLVALVVPQGAATRGTSSRGTSTGGDSPPDPLASATGAGVLGVGSGSSGQWTRRLRRHLAPHLPGPLRPVRYLLRDHLPITPAGKIDRRQVSEILTRDHRTGPADPVTSDGERSDDPSGTTTSTLERRLAAIWQRILGIDPPGSQVSFFELGGDSILALRIVAEAARQGLPLTPADLFEHPTLERLAAWLATRSPAPGPATPPTPNEPTREARGGAPLTPVQGWFFEEAALAEPHHFNQSMQWIPTRRLDAGRLRRALAKVVEHHQALRLRFRFGDGWTQSAVDRELSQLVLETDLSGLPHRHRAHAHQQVAEAIQSSLDLARGPLVRAALIDLAPVAEAGEEAPGSEQRLLLAIHHLVIDGVSWSIVVEDLERAYAGTSELDPTGLGYIDWARLQNQQAGAPLLTDEVSFWLDRPAGCPPLPRDHSPPAKVDLLAAEQVESVALDAESTEALLRRLPTVYGTRIDEVLLTAVLEAFAPWTGHDELLIDLEGHGRQALTPGLDLSRTVGWFTATYPVHLRRRSGPAGDPRLPSLGRTLNGVRDQLAAIPRRGIGHGILYFRSPDPAVRGALRLLPRPEVSFNYLGQLDALLVHSRLFEVAPEPRGRERGPRMRRPYLLEIDGGVVEGRLWINWRYSENHHRRDTIRQLAQRFLTALGRLIDPCRVRPSARHPATFDERAFPLAPLQEGLLFHSLLSPRDPLYCEQNSWRLRGPLDPGRWRRAWRLLFERHPALRVGIVWRGRDRPRQRVAERFPLPWFELDLRALPHGRRERELRRALAAQRRMGFDLERPPLTRLMLVQLDDDRWRFAWTTHHLLLDGWSLASLFDELFEIDDALRRDRLPPRPTRRPFREVVEWFEARDPTSAERFFRDLLTGFEGPTPVVPRPATREAVLGRRIQVRLPSARRRDLEAWGRSRGLTLATLLQATWGLLLARRARSHDAVFGLVVSGRSLPIEGIDTVVGLLINTLPMRVSDAPERSLGHWLRDLQRIHLELQQHGHLALSAIRRQLGLAADLPLFESILGFQNYPSHRAFLERRGAVTVEDPWSATGVHYPLALAVLPEDEITLDLGFDPRRIDPLDAHRIVRQLRTLLEGLCQRQDSDPVASLPWLERGERHQLLWEWNHHPTPATSPEASPWHEVGPPFPHRFDRQVARRPEALAVVQGEHRWSYRQLAGRVAGRVAALRRRRIGHEQRVAVLLDRSPDQIATVLAVWSVGAVLVPLDPLAPVGRWQNLLAEAGVEALVTEAHHLERLPAGALPEGARIVDLSKPDASPTSPEVWPLPLEPDQLAYILFTSGSTGRPKGAMVTHRGLANLSREPSFAARPGERVLQLATPAFDASIWELVAALGHGGTLELLPRGEPPAGAELEELLAAGPIHRALIPPSWLATMPTGASERLPHLDPLLVGGEPCPPELAHRWAHGRRLVNAYGPTEVAVCSAVHLLGPDDRQIAVGRPLAGLRILVLDRRLAPVPVGVVGEVVLAGAGLARGYLGRPARTAAVFVPNPWAGTRTTVDSEPGGGRLYRTGDLGRWGSAGTLEILGRSDHQVKVRGVRLELGEVETALESLSQVAQAVVLVEGEVGSPGRRLVAHVRPADDVGAGGHGAVDGWRRELLDRLPKALIPGRWVAHRELPRTPQGKVDRVALAAADASAPTVVEGETIEATATLDPREELVARLWGEVLDRPAPRDRRADFFELGGHSLLATQVVARVPRIFGVELPLRELFEYPTVGRLAMRIGELRRASAAIDEATIASDPECLDGPLSFAQERLWFLQQLEPASSAYNSPRAFTLEGPLDGVAFEGALRGLVERQAVLRTRYRMRGGRPRQRIEPVPTRVLSTVDLTGLPLDRRADTAHDLLERDAATPFDLARGPLFRAWLLVLAPERNLLLLNFHHSVLDAASLEILTHDLEALYRRHRGRPGSTLRPLPVRYLDFALWQRATLDEGRQEALLEAWRALGGAEPLPMFELPLDRPRPTHPRGHGRFHRRALSADTVAAIEDVARRHGATPYMVLLAHLVLWLRRLADRSKVVLGTPIANRTHPTLEPLVGFFVNALVLRLEVRRHDTVDDLIERTRDHVLATWDLQDLPFERLVQALRPRRRAGEHPLFQVSFTVRSPQPEERRLDDLRWRSLRLQHPRVRFDLEIYARLSDSGIEIEIGYDLDLLDATTIERWSQSLALLLDHGVARPGARVATLPWLRPAEVQQLIREWPTALAAAPPWLDPWSAILESTQRAPNAVALVLGESPQTGGTLSYGELLARVTPLAGALRRRGVGSEALVGVELDRSTGWLVGLLATLAVGAVFVPVDPRDPQGRRDAMLGRLPLALRIVAEDSPQTTSTIPRLRLHPSTGDLVETTATDTAAPDTAAPDTEDDEQLPATRGAGSPDGTALAYAIHTSGTTGSPKAIGVSRHALGLHLAAIGQAYALGPWDRVLWQASPAFDVSIEQTLAPLVWGATVVIGPRGVLERGGLVRTLVSQGVTVANLPPALWAWLANSERSPRLGSRTGERSALRLMVVGGDAMPAATLDPWFGGPWSSARLLDAYGPTEAVITASLEEVSASGARSTQQPPSPGLPIGRPVVGRTLRVVDRLGAPVPMGVVGELVLGGEALARGLLGDPRTTAERFRPDPWSDRPGARVLWSGDRARRTSDGRLEFFGRRDRQLEMRGIRIEPGEVEAALASHDGVREVWVGLSPNRDDPRLTAWIAGEPSVLRTLGRRHQLEHWKAVYQTLHGPDPEAGTIDGDRFLGWTSVLDGAPIPRPAMEDWLDQTVERVLALRPSRLLEIGCGHGLILEAVAEHCREVVGTDLSAAALAHLEQRLARDGGPRFELLAQAAHDFRHLETRQFDTIVLNSVVQYFPDLDYLIQVLEGAVAHLAWGGALFLGDVRSLPLLDLLHTLALRYRDSETVAGSPSGRRWPRQEGELVLDPFVFLALGERLPRLAGIHLRPKIDRHGSELVRFRYDVSLWFDRAPELQRPHLGEAETLQILRGDRGFPTLEHHLDRGNPLIRIDGVRPWRHGEGSEIRRLRNLLQHEPYAVELMWPAGDVFRRGNPGPADSVRLWLRRHPEADARSSQRPSGSPAAAWSTWATNPSRATGGEALVAELRRHLESLLPAAMRPAAYVLLDRLPRGPRAKVEARFLPPPGRGEAAPSPTTGLANGAGDLAAGQTVGTGGEPPRTPEEQRLAMLWAELLGIDEVPRDRTFFELGGHSLLATRLLAGIRRQHGIEISLRWFFGHPTVAELARRLTASNRQPARPGPTRRRGPGPAPLSHAQERLWFLDQLEPADSSYHLGVAYRLRGPLEVRALRRALVALEHQQDSLRTVFPAGDDGPMQVLEPATDRLLIVDLVGLGARAAGTVLGDRLRHQLSNTAFALDRGPLTRAVLLRRDTEDHELVLVQHHIVSDGWSLALILEQLGSLYAAERRAQGQPIPTRRPNYADYASWQRRRLDDGTLDPSREFWRRQLRDAPRLDLPTDHPRGQRPARGDSVPVRIDPALGTRLEGLSRERGVSLYMLLLAAFGELLGRWAGQGEVVLGSPVANRPHDDLETLVGFFVNTVVLRTATPRDDDFASRLTRVRDVALAAFAHSEVPFDVVVGDLSPQRSLGRNPLFQVSLGFQNTHLARRSVATPSPQGRPDETGPEELRLDGLEVEALDLPLTAVVFELELHLWPVAGALEGFFAFRRDLFDPTTILRLAHRLERLLHAVSSAPEQPLHGLDLMTSGERHQLLVEWSTALPSLRPDPPLADTAEGGLWPRVEGWVRRSPRHPAIDLGERRWTYRQLERRVAALGHRLRDLGVGVEVPVGVCYPPGLDGLVAMLAIHAVGGVAVPLDPTHPPARRAALLAQVGAHWILGDVDPTDTRVAAINPPDPGEVETTPPLGRPVVDAKATAYVLFTSGSTGRPKPVPVSRDALERHLRAMQRDLPLETDDVVLVRTSPAFDPSLWELWAPLLVGARLVIADRATRRDPRRMVRLLQRRRVRVSRVSPALLGLLLDEPGFGQLGTLRRLLCGGEALPPSLVERFRSRGPSGATLVNVYGPTETTINVAYEVLPTESPLSGSGAPGSGAPGSIALGRPLGEARWTLLGPGHRPVALGEVGELTLGGPTLARGYARRPADTAQVFVPAAGSAAGARQYRSGDRARWLPDGRVQFLGRRDQQVQLRGFRIELGEVEAALRELPQAHDALAMVRRLDPADRGREPVLVGFVVASSPQPDTSDWMAGLRSRLPPFMVPSLLMPLETLPRTASGKIDRHRLSRLPLDRDSGPRGRAPRDPREELLAALFAEGLGLDQIDIDRDFFELGGHSLLATRVVSRIRKVFRCSLDLATFFSHPTVGELAHHLDPGGEDHEPWRAGPRPDPLPLSPGQRRLWFLAQLDPTDGAYNMPVAIELEGPLDPATLFRAWDRLRARHESLRTHFPSRSGTPHQAIEAADSPWRMPVLDLSSLSRQRAETVAHRLVGHEADRPFDLARGPLVRLHLVRLDDHRHQLWMVFHHAIADGWSKGLVLHELLTIYQGLAEGVDPVLSPLPLQPADVAVLERQEHERTDDEAEARWRDRLSGLQPLRLPTDRPRPARRASRGGAVPLRVAGDTLVALRRSPERAPTTPFMTLLATVVAWLQRLTGQQDFALASPMARRHREELEPLVGFFVDTLVLRVDVGDDPSLPTLLQRLRHVVLEGMDRRAPGLDRLVQLVRPERAPSRTPLVDVSVSLHQGETTWSTPGALEAHELEIPSHHAQFDLDFDLWLVDGELEGLLTYRRDLFDATTIERWVGQWSRLLVALGDDADRPLSHHGLLAPSELHQLLWEWGCGPLPTGNLGIPIHRRIFDHARRQPDDPAVVYDSPFGIDALSYGELAGLAHALTHELLDAGVTTETPVAVVAPRGPALVVGILAVLAAGGTWVALDPGEPARRLAEIARGAAIDHAVVDPDLDPPLPWEPAVEVLIPELGTVTPDDEPPELPDTDPDQLAYLVHTSGSTGRPKGVMVTHGGWVNAFEAWRSAYDLDRLRRHLQAAGSMFDVFAGDFARALASGGTLVVAPREVTLDPSALTDFVELHAIETGELVPAVARGWLEHLEREDRDLGPIELLVVGSDRWPTADLRRLRRLAGPRRRLVNSYGLSEATIDSTWYEDLGERPTHGAQVPIGRPFAGSRTRVVDTRLALRPIGAVGELGVAGVGLARGYLGDPARTALRFVPDAESPSPGGRLYRTGDAVRLDAEGNLDVLGRLDQQLKVRGLRVEPGEIEASMARLADLREVAVVAVPTSSGGPTLVAWLVPRDGAQPPSPRDLRDLLRQHLPLAMVPSRFESLDRLPRNRNGKIDRTELVRRSRPEVPDADAGRREPPRGAIETTLATLWSELLEMAEVGGQDGPGRDSDFFELGGHSLLVTRLAAGIRRTWGVEVGLGELLAAPGLADQAALIRRRRSDPAPAGDRSDDG